MDLDAEIVRTWLEANGYFVRTSVRYLPGKGLADIDVLAVHPMKGGKHGRIWGEVKGWVEQAGKIAMPASWDIIGQARKAFRDPKRTKFVDKVLGKKYTRTYYAPAQRLSNIEKSKLRALGVELVDLAKVVGELRKIAAERGSSWHYVDKGMRFARLLAQTT